jgi:hypothetical protein
MQDGPDPEASAPPTSDAGGPNAGAAAADRERVAATLEQLRAGVRQRHAELATMGATGGAIEAQAKVLQVKEHEYLREPAPTSHRSGLGRWIVLARKAGYKLFGKWLVRPLVEQQNAYNAAATAALSEVVEAEERLAGKLRELAARIERLEARERSSGSGPESGAEGA